MARGNVRRLASKLAARGLDLRVMVATGAGANTNIAVTGIKRGDVLLSVIEVPAATTTLVDRTSTSSVTSDGNIQSTASTAGNQVLVYWMPR